MLPRREWQVLYVYLVVLPAQFKDCRDPNDPNNGTYPVWLQDAGEFEVRSQFKHNYIPEMWSGSEEGSYSRLKDCCITQL